jgi:tannase
LILRFSFFGSTDNMRSSLRTIAAAAVVGVAQASSSASLDSVCTTSYVSFTLPHDSITAMNDWYRLFLVPGAAHCATNDLQPNGPFPQTNFAVMIDWVENGIEPTTLNATVLQGVDEGASKQICGWPLRPFWTNDTMVCEYDQASIDSWIYTLDSFLMPVD